MRILVFALAGLAVILPIAASDAGAASNNPQDAENLCLRFAADPFAGTGPQEWGHPFGSVDPFRALPPCKAALSGKPDDQALNLAIAMALVALRKNDEAKPLLSRLVAEGNVSAMLTLSFISDGAAATALMKKAADAGNPSGMMLYGMSQVMGKGTPRDAVDGVRMIRKAAEAGSTRAMLILANFYAKGEYGVGYDPKEAERLVALAASKGDSTAKDNLAGENAEDAATR